MTQRRQRKDDVVSFQITPMIDMTFLLLIFFMVTSKLSKEQVKIDISLPTASAARIPDDLSNRDVINVLGCVLVVHEFVLNRCLVNERVFFVCGFRCCLLLLYPVCFLHSLV